MVRRTIRSGLAVAATLVGGALLAAGGPALGQSPAPSASPVPVPPANDLWFADGDELRRVDGATGSLVFEASIADPACPIDPTGTSSVTPVGDTIWIVNNQPDPPCVIAVGADGSNLRSWPIAAPVDGRLMVGDVTASDGAAWLSTATLDTDTGKIGGYTIWKLDLESGAVEKVIGSSSGIGSAASAIATLHHVKGGKGFYPGILDPSMGDFKAIKGGKAQQPADTPVVRSGGNRFVFYSLLKGPGQAFDPATGTLSDIAMPKDMLGLTGLFASDDGVLFGGIADEDGARFLRFQPWDGKQVDVPDPCGAQVAPACVSFAAGATPGGLWVLSGPTTDEGDFDWRRATLSRVDPATLTTTAMVSGSVIVNGSGTLGASPSPSPAS